MLPDDLPVDRQKLLT